MSNMKNLPCDICGEACAADNFKAWFQLMLAHWKENHRKEMDDMHANYTKEDGEKWMADHQAEFEAL